MTAIVRTQGLGKKYNRNWALADCTLDIPAGHVTGLVGPNGAGKSTLLNLAAGMLAPTSGTIQVCGGSPGSGPAQLAKVGFVAQDTPTYARLSVDDHLRLGARLNPSWDDTLARHRINQLGLNPDQPAGRLSGGQRAQLALTLGIAKRPELLILDGLPRGEVLLRGDVTCQHERPLLVGRMSWLVGAQRRNAGAYRRALGLGAPYRADIAPQGRADRNEPHAPRARPLSHGGHQCGRQIRGDQR